MASGLSSQQMYSTPGTLHSVSSYDLRQWAHETAAAEGIPREPDTRSWRRRMAGPPTWLQHGRNGAFQQHERGAQRPAAAATPDTALVLRSMKRSFWARAPYMRELRIQTTAAGPIELATLHPRSKRVTNRWWTDELIDVITEGLTVYLALPGHWFKSRTYLEVKLPSSAQADALVANWGWELCDDPSAGCIDVNPPVVTHNGDSFVFNHN
jgi:hypothetical protein